MHQERREQFFALADVWRPRSRRSWRNRDRLHTQLARRLCHRNMRPPERPTATQRDVHPHPQPMRFFVGKAQRVQMLRGKKRRVVESRRRIVQPQRIQRRNLHAANACRLHLLQLARNLSPGRRRPKPPPPHHDPARIRRMRKLSMQFRQARPRLRCRRAAPEPECKYHRGCRSKPRQTFHPARSGFLIQSQSLLCSHAIRAEDISLRSSPLLRFPPLHCNPIEIPHTSRQSLSILPMDPHTCRNRAKSQCSCATGARETLPPPSTCSSSSIPTCAKSPARSSAASGLRTCCSPPAWSMSSSSSSSASAASALKTASISTPFPRGLCAACWSITPAQSGARSATPERPPRSKRTWSGSTHAPPK